MGKNANGQNSDSDPMEVCISNKEFSAEAMELERQDNLENSLRYRKSINKDKHFSGTNKCKESCSGSPPDGDSFIPATKCEEVVMDILLKHYRTMKFLGFSMTWLGVHKLYRMALVACYTYIKEPLPRLSAMTVLVIVMGVATMGFKPYKDNKANKTANMSYIASAFIAMINVSKASLITANYRVSSAAVMTTLEYFDVCENILLTWLPLVAIVIWMCYSLWQRFGSKDKKKKKKEK